MPPEPVPWDRKDFFKERKHERPESLGSGSRWRDSPSHHGSREFARWGSGDFRRAPGHGKQGGWHAFTEENGHGYSPSWSGGKILEDDRPSISHGDGKCGRNSRENRGSFNPREWKGHTWETSNGSLNAPGRLLDVDNNSEQRSVDNVPHSDTVNIWDQLHLKERHDNKIGLINGLGTGQRSERESSLDWKPLKWIRSGSLSSRGSGFSHSSSSKSLGGADSNEGKAELLHKNASPVQSPSVDGAACVTSSVPFEDTTSRKKPRLGWGEGLAKYEKKKVEGPDVCVNKEGNVVCASNLESNHSLSSNFADKSPKVVGFSDCASPATPSSFACSSSPGVEDKSSGKAVNMDNDIITFCGSPNLGSQNFLEGISFNLEKLDVSSIVNLGSSLVDLLQMDDPSAHSSFARSSAMNKLLLCKSNVLKVLEMTELEIDLLENELKLLKFESKNGCLCLATSGSVHTEENAKLCSELGSKFVMVPRPPPLQVDTADAIVEECNREELSVGGEDIESPGTATSKLAESISLEKAVSSSALKCSERSGELDASQPTNLVASLVNTSNEEDVVVSSGREGSLPLKIMNDRTPITNDVGFHTDVEHKLSEAILTENNESANKAFEVFNKLLPSKQSDFTGVANVVSWRKDSFIKERFAGRQRFLRFKERVITLKFKAFQHLWKEDMRALSVRKHRAKSQKKSDLGLRTTHGVYQKHRSSIRSRFSSPGNVSLVPTTEIINFTSKLLSDSRVKHCREALKMPALILDNKEKMLSRFTSSNGLLEDPLAVEKERTLVNPWTLEEKEIFMDKLAVFGKDFRKIASFLDHKTTADCVEFYYQNHKSDCFEWTKKKKLDLGKQKKSVTNSTYMVASGKKWNREVNAASLELLGAASVMATHVDNGTGSQQMCPGNVFRTGYNDSKVPQVDDVMVERPGSFDIHGNERETVAADVLAGICSSLSSEAMSFCLTSSADHGEGYQERRYQNMNSVVKGPSTSDVTQYVDYETCSDESSGEMDPADWTDGEKSIFIQSVSSYGKDFTKIARCVRTRSMDQCKVFFSKARKCLGLDLLHPEPRNVGTPASDDANGGGDDAEDACIFETGSTVCSDKMGSKMDGDLPLSVINSKQYESNHMKYMDLETDLNKSEGKDWMGPPESNNCKTVKTSMPDMCQAEVRAEQVSECDQKSSVESATTEARKDEVTEQGFATAGSASVGEAVDLGASSSNVMVEKEAVGEVSSGNSLEREVLLPSLSDKVDRKHCGDPSSHSGSMQDPNASGNAHQLSVDTSACSPSRPISENKQQVLLKLDSLEKPPVICIPKEHCVSTSISVAHDSAVITSDKMLVHDRPSSTLDVQASADKQGHKSVGQDDCQQHLSLHPSSNHIESPQIITGYPLQIPTKKDMNRDSSCRQLSEVHNYCNSDGNLTGPSLTQDCYLQKCNSSSKLPCTVAEFTPKSQKKEQIAGYPRGHSKSLSDAEKPCGNGDFKLFGAILSHPSSAQKADSISISHENDERGIHQPRQSSKTSNIKFTSHPIAEGNTGVLKFDRNNNLGGLENVPIRSYGFWDGNRIQTGFSALPDSTRLLSTYPAAFANYQGSTLKIDQQSLQAVIKNNERNVNVLSPREIGGANGLLDYQLYRSPDGTKVHPFAVDMRQRQEALLAEIQKRNGYEAVSSSQQQQQQQQQGRAMVGMNVVGRGGILVGGPCTGVSDPVAAIKMHYAKTDLYGGHSGGIIREQEWRGNGET
ncbi:hypothetical protein HS088_TW16G00200 [Tripterygium wilfordii]|uniref:SANT domain-containing protein n=1 Tax=Tripterygium wilfordii TaxID=458696 RepID=A0A7J7CI89_TRIWF|nr:uncharacterized protein LOC119980977 isoform X2 [Tripterygium wilfordii]KAF5733760.1 hypothetical protein HS088_TW16G00200 [Tripterygium wilfordii]